MFTSRSRPQVFVILFVHAFLKKKRQLLVFSFDIVCQGLVNIYKYVLMSVNGCDLLGAPIFDNICHMMLHHISCFVEYLYSILHMYTS